MCNEQGGRPYIRIIGLGDLKVSHSNKTAHQHKGDDVALFGTADAAHCVHKVKYVGRHGNNRQDVNRQRCARVASCGSNHLKDHQADAHYVIQGLVRLTQPECVKRDVVVVACRGVPTQLPAPAAPLVHVQTSFEQSRRSVKSTQ